MLYFLKCLGLILVSRFSLSIMPTTVLSPALIDFLFFCCNSIRIDSSQKFQPLKINQNDGYLNSLNKKNVKSDSKFVKKKKKKILTQYLG